jgi:hypothetical protein
MAQMRLGQAPILAGSLDCGGGLHGVAEGLHRDARRRRDMLIANGDGRAFLQNGLANWFHHLAASLAYSGVDFGRIG